MGISLGNKSETLPGSLHEDVVLRYAFYNQLEIDSQYEEGILRNRLGQLLS